MTCDGSTSCKRRTGDAVKPTAFDLFHPAVALAYFGVLLILGMAALQPVYVLVTFVAALAYAVVLRGARATARTLAWQLPLVVVVALANPLFSASGSTELFRIGLRAFYLESFVFGACMGLMLASMLLVLSNASHVLTSDKVLALFGNVAPTVGLMLSMTARLVPQFVRRGTDIAATQRACTAAQGSGGEGNVSAQGERGGRGKLEKRALVRDNLRLTSVLMGWSMEDSLETASAMKARGWGAGARRTTYTRYRFRTRDAAALAVGGALALAAAVAAWVACAQFRFYPTIEGLAPWWNYLPFVLFAALPLIMEAVEKVRWRL
ncbi:energy-coupling factor transporter transmembrane component T [Gordonibacter faecis]|uniref:Energy-coupling factor transporter transmembrane component T n=1 Tax=Gordonibacter faecis TaxID=3047475 RepID=A0ABT7DR15_9ACTN|nr:energy-coupling factor transporter transmembrane component T [Gordonibacter sp. KGMB12511]MDJ1651862.1 energy-coupling factor transporter transmembrane component T [Gordonibacter sp. KGMB12511]